MDELIYKYYFELFASDFDEYSVLKFQFQRTAEGNVLVEKGEVIVIGPELRVPVVGIYNREPADDIIFFLPPSPPALSERLSRPNTGLKISSENCMRLDT